MHPCSYPFRYTLALVLAVSLNGCKRSEPQTTTPVPPTPEARADGTTPAATKAAPADPQAPMTPVDPSAPLPAGHPPIPVPGDTPAAAGAAAAAIKDGRLALPGVTLAVPETWLSKPVSPGGMGPVAVFDLSNPGGDGPIEVRITHFPGMKGMDDANIDRWLTMVLTADGQPTARDAADISVREQDGVKLTLIDASGSVPTSGAMMGTGGSRIENGRMIAAIVDHAMGPHYVKVLGPADAMERWSESIFGFINSAEQAAP